MSILTALPKVGHQLQIAQWIVRIIRIPWNETPLLRRVILLLLLLCLCPEGEGLSIGSGNRDRTCGQSATPSDHLR